MFIAKRYFDGNFGFDEDIYPWYHACRKSKGPLCVKNCISMVNTFRAIFSIITAVPSWSHLVAPPGIGVGALIQNMTYYQGLAQA